MELVVNDLAVSRGGRRLFSNLALRAHAGDVVLIKGPNGSGKTTLIRTLAGFIEADTGDVRLTGAGPDDDLSLHCHYVGHLNGIKAIETVAQNLAFWRDFLQTTESQAAREPNLDIEQVMIDLDLEPLADIPAGYLSAGQKRRLCLARLVVAHRPVWLLDEPTTSLDARSQETVARLIGQHAAAGGIVLAATHLPLAIGGARDLALAVGQVSGTPA